MVLHGTNSYFQRSPFAYRKSSHLDPTIDNFHIEQCAVSYTQSANRSSPNGVVVTTDVGFDLHDIVKLAVDKDANSTFGDSELEQEKAIYILQLFSDYDAISQKIPIIGEGKRFMKYIFIAMSSREATEKAQRLFMDAKKMCPTARKR